jgi:hypothetical protein
MIFASAASDAASTLASSTRLRVDLDLLADLFAGGADALALLDRGQQRRRLHLRQLRDLLVLLLAVLDLLDRGLLERVEVAAEQPELFFVQVLRGVRGPGGDGDGEGGGEYRSVAHRSTSLAVL